MPNYHLKHNDAVRSLEKKLTSLLPNLILAGASYYGVGIGACIKDGQVKAEMVIDTLLNVTY